MMERDFFAIHGDNFENSSKHQKLLRFDEKFRNFFLAPDARQASQEREMFKL